jgi:DNA replication and repair protein RecF
MRLLSLRLENFRNLEHVEVTPSHQATVCVGQNGQGKTNLLEGLFYLCTLKPLRAGKLSELVRFGEKTATVTGEFELKGARRIVSVVVSDGARQAFVDGKKAASLEEYFGGLSVVAFTPDDLAVVKGGPDGRRQLLDRAVFNRFPAFLKESRDYARTLKSRNRLLKDRAPGSYLEVYDQTLAKTGARLWIRRRALMRELAAKAAQAFAHIGRTASPAVFHYAPSFLAETFETLEEDSLALALAQKLEARRERDSDRGFTSVGPHADDLSIGLGEISARSFASQGQQRALVLAWKIAEIENLESALGFLPLLLLDDVSSELDPERNAYLMDYLARSGAQTFLTTTDESLVRGATGVEATWFAVKSGTVTPTGPT